jgi:hypothetical protein
MQIILIMNRVIIKNYHHLHRPSCINPFMIAENVVIYLAKSNSGCCDEK